MKTTTRIASSTLCLMVVLLLLCSMKAAMEYSVSSVSRRIFVRATTRYNEQQQRTVDDSLEDSKRIHSMFVAFGSNRRRREGSVRQERMK
jgi:cell division protein FtsX